MQLVLHCVFVEVVDVSLLEYMDRIVLYPVCYGRIGLVSISISLSLLKIQSM